MSEVSADICTDSLMRTQHCNMARVAAVILFALVTCFLVKIGESCAHTGKVAPKKRHSPPPAFVQAPWKEHFFVSRGEPVNLTLVATNVCKIQIRCNGEKFDEGAGRVCGSRCRKCKTRTETKIIKVSDFPGKNKSIKCQGKVWGTTVLKTKKIIVERAFLGRKFRSSNLCQIAPQNATVILKCKPPVGSPRPTITWYKNGAPLSFGPGERVSVISKKNVTTNNLIFRSLLPNDSGEYQCVAQNMAARRQGPKIRLEVIGNSSSGVCDYRRRNEQSRLSPSRALLIVGTEDFILKTDLRNTSKMTHIQEQNVMLLDFSSDSNQIYWSNKKEINQLSLRTGHSEVMSFHHNDVNSVPFPEGLAVDWVNKKLYWTDAKRDAIYVGDLHNGRQVKLVEGKLDYPKAIAVSPSDGYIYWIDRGQASVIERARLDGTERKVLSRNGIQFPNSLEVDELGKKLYWAGTDNDNHGIIEALSLDGLNRTVIFYQQGYHPFCLDIYKGYVYWSDWAKNAVLRIKSDASGEVEFLIPSLNKPMGLKILRPRKEWQNNSCDENNGGYEYLCMHLPIHGKQKCFCKENMKLKENGKTCEKRQVLQGEGKDRQFNSTMLALIIVIALLLLLLTIVLLKKCASCFGPTDLPRIPRMEGEDAREDIEEDLATDHTELMRADSQPNNVSTASNQQVRNAGPSGASADREDTPVQTDVVVYMTKTNTVNMNMNMTKTINNVALQQSGGVTVIGNEAKINYHQPPES